MNHFIRYSLAVSYALSFYVLPSPGAQADQNGGFSKEVINWQKECLMRNIYARAERRESLSRFRISIQVPEGTDFLLDQGPSDTSVRIAEIRGIVLKRCGETAARLHNIQLPGGGFSSISIEGGARHPKAGDDRFLDAVTILGKKYSIYDDGVEVWASFINPAGMQNLTVSGYEVGLNEFKRFVGQIQTQK